MVNHWLVITGILAAVFAAAAFLFQGQSLGTAKEGDEYFPLCEYISIDLLKTDVAIIPWEEDEIRFTYRSGVPLDVEVGDNSLTITESTEFVISLFAGDAEDYGVYLYLPREYYRDILIYTVSGDVILGDVDSEKITVVTNSGRITSEETRSLCSLTTGSGDILLDFYSVIPGSSVQSRTGNAEIVFPKGSSVTLDFETKTGEFHTELISGTLSGSYKYSFNGGAKQLHAALETGVLTVSEK